MRGRKIIIDLFNKLDNISYHYGVLIHMAWNAGIGTAVSILITVVFVALGIPIRV